MTDRIVHSSKDSDCTSSSLLVRAVRNDGEAWERIVQCYGEMVYRWCRAAGLSPEAARDVGQDVFLSAYRSLPSYRPRHEVGSFRSWLRAITKSKFLDFLKKPANRQAIGGSEALRRLEQVEFPADADELVNSDVQLLYEQIEKYIRSQFSTAHCEAFFRVTLREESPGDVADSLGMTRNAVYLACTRIRKRVKDEFGELLGDAASI